ncbi:MAG: MarR family transcriptional regulator [Vibrio sp.]
MRLAHKRKVQAKLQKRMKAIVANLSSTPKADTSAKVEPVAKKAAIVTPQKESVAKPADVTVTLTPKQQQVLDIVVANTNGINPKSIGLAAGQEDAKAASWATGALKKLLQEELVVKEQLSGNKVIYKTA